MAAGVVESFFSSMFDNDSAVEISDSFTGVLTKASVPCFSLVCSESWAAAKVSSSSPVASEVSNEEALSDPTV